MYVALAKDVHLRRGILKIISTRIISEFFIRLETDNYEDLPLLSYGRVADPQMDRRKKWRLLCTEIFIRFTMKFLVMRVRLSFTTESSQKRSIQRNT